MGNLSDANNRRGRLTLLRRLVTVFALAALASLCLEYGFDHPPVPVGILICVQVLAVAAYVATVAAAMFAAPSLVAAVKKQWPDVLLIVVAGVLLVVFFEVTHLPVLKVGTVYVGLIQVLLVLRAVAGVVRWNLEMSRRPLHPARLLVTSFLVVIVTGALLLSLPKAVSPAIRAESGQHIAAHIVKSFFTATSATCVTGLVVYDTGTDFTRFGQAVILVLIQLGGLGIMISSTLFGMLIGRQLSLRQSLVLQDALSRQTIGRLGVVLRFIMLTTFACELVGAALCYPMFAPSIEPLGERLFQCAFHAVSAFCNAGFALRADSLTAFGASWGLYTSIMPLIVMGGLGFPVLHDVWGWLKERLRPAAGSGAGGLMSRRRGGRLGKRAYRLNLHTKLVLSTTAGLILVPAVLLFVFESVEWRSLEQREAAASIAQMAELPVLERAGAALFQSVTARTAGFNTVFMDDDALSPASHVLLMLLMFVGGSPSSTAGGVKTVAVAVLVLSIVSTMRQRPNVEAFGRTIPAAVVNRAAVVVVVMGAVLSLVVLSLCVTESASLREIMFESVSACGTVGLSAGLTGRLTSIGQIIIMLAMFAGRLGPLTMIIALAGRQRPPARYEYAPEQVTIG